MREIILHKKCNYEEFVTDTDFNLNSFKQDYMGKDHITDISSLNNVDNTYFKLRYEYLPLTKDILAYFSSETLYENLFPLDISISIINDNHTISGSFDNYSLRGNGSSNYYFSMEYNTSSLARR